MTKMHVFGIVTGYKMTGRIWSEDVREEMRITDIRQWQKDTGISL